MMPPLEGQTIVVTGGAKNLGASVCNDVAALGVNIAVHYHSDDDAGSAKDVVANVVSQVEKRWPWRVTLRDARRASSSCSR